MVQKGTYTEFLKSGLDFGSLLKKENEEAEQASISGSPTLRHRTFSESSVWSQQSSRPSLKDGSPESKAVSFSSCSMPWFCLLLVASWVFILLRSWHRHLSQSGSYGSEGLILGICRIKTERREQGWLGLSFGYGMENLVDISSEYAAISSYVYVAHSDWHQNSGIYHR